MLKFKKQLCTTCDVSKSENSKFSPLLVNIVEYLVTNEPSGVGRDLNWANYSKYLTDTYWVNKVTTTNKKNRAGL